MGIESKEYIDLIEEVSIKESEIVTKKIATDGIFTSNAITGGDDFYTID